MQPRSYHLVLALTLLAASNAAADPVVRRGVDAFATPATGNTFIDFAQNPLPAGFLCEGSAPFTGKVALEGRPIVTSSERLNGIDTVVERLDDAPFDLRGVARTRIRLAALSLGSIKPIETDCGRYDVRVSLAGTQRETVMRIVRENERGGTFVAPLAVDAQVSFVPLDNGLVERRSLSVAINFPGPKPEPWSFATGTPRPIQEPFSIDRDGDGTPETWLEGASNFLATSAQGPTNRIIVPTCIDGVERCHADPASSKQHCYCVHY